MKVVFYFVGIIGIIVAALSLMSIATSMNHKAMSYHQRMTMDSALLLNKYRKDMQNNMPRQARKALNAYSVTDPTMKLIGGKATWNSDLEETDKMTVSNIKTMNTGKAIYEKQYGSFLGSSIYGWHLLGQMK